jgi:hypothetical protein
MCINRPKKSPDQHGSADGAKSNASCETLIAPRMPIHAAFQAGSIWSLVNGKAAKRASVTLIAHVAMLSLALFAHLRDISPVLQRPLS